MTSLEGWGSAIELRPRDGSHRRLQHTGSPGGPASRLNAPAPPRGPLSAGRSRVRDQGGTRLPGPALQAGRG
jgi:hypothetical protein